jgi:hypothetical protein
MRGDVAAMSPRRHSPPCHTIQASLLAPVCTPAVTGSRGRPKKEPAPSRHGIQRPPPKGACTQPSWDPRLPAPVWLFPCASSAPVHHTAIQLPQRSMPSLRPSSREGAAEFRATDADAVSRQMLPRPEPPKHIQCLCPTFSFIVIQR